MPAQIIQEMCLKLPSSWFVIALFVWYLCIKISVRWFVSRAKASDYSILLYISIIGAPYIFIVSIFSISLICDRSIFEALPRIILSVFMTIAFQLILITTSQSHDGGGNRG